MLLFSYRQQWRTKIFIISYIFSEKVANLYVSTPSWRVGALSYGESWIRPWLTHTERQRLMLVYGDTWKSVPDPFPSITVYANTSSNADARCGCALNGSLRKEGVLTWFNWTHNILICLYFYLLHSFGRRCFVELFIKWTHACLMYRCFNNYLYDK